MSNPPEDTPNQQTPTDEHAASKKAAEPQSPEAASGQQGDEPAQQQSSASAGTPESAPKRKIRIGSQRSSKPLSSMKPVPPPMDMRPAKARAQPQETASTEQSKKDAEQPTKVEAQPAAEQAKKESQQPTTEAAKPPAREPKQAQQQKSFSDMAAEQSPEIAASVEKVLSKKEQPAPSSTAESAETEPADEDIPEVAFKPPSQEDLDAEIEAALGDVSLDDILAGEEQSTAKAGEQLAPETRLPAPVMKVGREYVFFALGSRNQGIAGLRQFREPPAPGETMDVVIQKFDAEEGLYEVTVPGASVEVADWGDIDEGVVVEARVTGHNTGGLECEVNRIRGFIPMSQIALHRVENPEDYVGQKLACVVTEANEQRGNLVLSHRAMLEREQEENREKFFEQLEVGQVHQATVRKLMDFGAFAEIAPGVDGLIHISQLSWDRVDHPSDVLKEGQKVEVKIEKIDPHARKIGLSYRELQDNPWNNVARKYPVGSIVSGTVSRVAQFGAFVKLEPGVEGLVHISELAHHRVSRPGSVVKEGQEVEVKVLDVDEEKQRISLSMKEARQPPADESNTSAEDAADEPPRELAVPHYKGPLKGGTDKKTGGEKFGLNW